MGNKATTTATTPPSVSSSKTASSKTAAAVVKLTAPEFFDVGELDVVDDDDDDEENKRPSAPRALLASSSASASSEPLGSPSKDTTTLLEDAAWLRAPTPMRTAGPSGPSGLARSSQSSLRSVDSFRHLPMGPSSSSSSDAGPCAIPAVRRACRTRDRTVRGAVLEGFFFEIAQAVRVATHCRVCVAPDALTVRSRTEDPAARTESCDAVLVLDGVPQLKVRVTAVKRPPRAPRAPARAPSPAMSVDDDRDDHDDGDDDDDDDDDDLTPPFSLTRLAAWSIEAVRRVAPETREAAVVEVLESLRLREAASGAHDTKDAKDATTTTTTTTTDGSEAAARVDVDAFSYRVRYEDATAATATDAAAAAATARVSMQARFRVSVAAGARVRGASRAAARASFEHKRKRAVAESVRETSEVSREVLGFSLLRRLLQLIDRDADRPWRTLERLTGRSSMPRLLADDVETVPPSEADADADAEAAEAADAEADDAAWDELEAEWASTGEPRSHKVQTAGLRKINKISKKLNRGVVWAKHNVQSQVWAPMLGGPLFSGGRTHGRAQRVRVRVRVRRDARFRPVSIVCAHE